MEFVRSAFSKDSPIPDVAALAMAAHEIDMRMLVQRPAFTIHRDPTDLVEVVGDKKLLYAFDISKGSRGYIRRWLAAAGISESTLFPGLSELAYELGWHPDDGLP
jgi:hypothetical protein